MGTNYYWHSDPCPTCGHSKEELHIGKSSGGWCFSLRVYPGEENKPQNLNDWKKWLKKNSGKILDEYDRKVTVKEMLDVITKRSWNVSIEESFKNHAEQHLPYYKSLEDFLDKNHAFLGPKNLLRARVDGRHCIGNGKGTWDLIAGEFF